MIVAFLPPLTRAIRVIRGCFGLLIVSLAAASVT
jgi:hypothetical protein